jgi:hypothetical protein
MTAQELIKREVVIMEKQLRDYVEELLKDYDKLHGLLWDMMAEAYTTKQNYLGKYCLMVWDDGTIDTHYFTGNEWFRGEDEGTIYRVATVKEWNCDEHDEWEDEGDTLIDTAKRIMNEYSEETSDQIDHIIENAKFEFEHIAD